MVKCGASGESKRQGKGIALNIWAFNVSKDIKVHFSKPTNETLKVSAISNKATTFF